MRFSLRELLLATFALAALLGWGLLLYKSYQTHQVTPFLANNYAWQKDISAIRDKLNETGLVVDMDSAGYPGRSSYYQESSYRFSLSPGNAPLLMVALSERIRQAVTDSGCEPINEAGVNQLGHGEYLVIVRYRHRDIDGVLRIRLIEKLSDDARLWFIAHERRLPLTE